MSTILKDIKEGESGIKGFVDLDLPSGNLWAECNLGTENPWEVGSYYYFGLKVEPISYNQYNTEIYTYYKEAGKLVESGILDSTLSLNPLYDSANLNNDLSSIPTSRDFLELCTYCTKTYVESYTDSEEVVHNVKGFIFSRNEKSIFLPLTGCKSENLILQESLGMYQTKNAVQDKYNNNIFAFLHLEPSDLFQITLCFRYLGTTIRPVIYLNMASPDRFGQVKMSEKSTLMLKAYLGRIARDAKGAIYAVNAYTPNKYDEPAEEDEHIDFSIPGTVVICYNQNQFSSPALPTYPEYDLEKYQQKIKSLSIPHWSNILKIYADIYGGTWESPNEPQEKVTEGEEEIRFGFYKELYGDGSKENIGLKKQIQEPTTGLLDKTKKLEKEVYGEGDILSLRNENASLKSDISTLKNKINALIDTINSITSGSCSVESVVTDVMYTAASEETPASVSTTKYSMWEPPSKNLLNGINKTLLPSKY